MTKFLFSLLLAVTLPAFGQTVKFDHEPSTNAIQNADEVLVNVAIAGTTNFITMRTASSNLVSKATNAVRLAAGSAVTITTNADSTGVTYTLSGGGGLPTTAPVWSRFATNASYTLSTNFYLHAWTALSVAGTITLPSASSCSNLHLVIKDQGGNCSSTNVTIAAANGDRIDGSTTNVINTNFGARSLYSAGSTNWYVY